MKIPLAIVLLFTTPAWSAGDLLISVDYFHSMRIPNNHVSVKLDDSGNLTVLTETRDAKAETKKARISDAALTRFKESLTEIDWQIVSRDKVFGLDGTSVRIVYEDYEIKLWSPDYDSKDRGLSEVQEVIERLFDFADLNEAGMPKAKEVEQAGGGNALPRASPLAL